MVFCLLSSVFNFLLALIQFFEKLHWRVELNFKEIREKNRATKLLCKSLVLETTKIKGNKLTNAIENC